MTTDASHSRAAFRVSIQLETTEMVPGTADDFNDQAEAAVTATVPISTEAILVAHTDGACSGNPGPGGWGVVFSQAGAIVDEFSGGDVYTTNNRMELTAIGEAIRRAPRDVILEIATDSNNAIGWLSLGWKRNDPRIGALCADIDRLRAERAAASSDKSGEVRFRHVRGHRGDWLNERADRLATAAIARVRAGLDK
jgi:ribonuclease HI